MKTLYININNELIQSNDKLEVLKHDLDSDFFFYLGSKIARGCNVENVIALVTDFKNEDKEEYKQIIAQWNDLKAILFSEKCEGEFGLTLPNGYIHWLKFHSQYVDIYDKNFSQGKSAVISVDLEELYEESVEELQRKILGKLKRDDLYKEIDKIVFNDALVPSTSMIVNSVRKVYSSVSVLSLNEWLEQKRLERERLENEKIEKERLVREQQERERLAQEQLEQERLVNERLNKKYIECENTQNLIVDLRDIGGKQTLLELL